jgi:hypothetical protein
VDLITAATARRAAHTRWCAAAAGHWPNQLWSWDITKLLGPAKWTYFYSGADCCARHLIDSADMVQTVFDFIAQVAPAKAADLDALLMQIAQDVPGNAIVPFGKLPSVHFSNMVVFDSLAFGSYLVWEHNVDTNREAYLDELLSHAPGIDQCLP